MRELPSNRLDLLYGQATGNKGLHVTDTTQLDTSHNPGSYLIILVADQICSKKELIETVTHTESEFLPAALATPSTNDRKPHSSERHQALLDTSTPKFLRLL